METLEILVAKQTTAVRNHAEPFVFENREIFCDIYLFIFIYFFMSSAKALIESEEKKTKHLTSITCFYLSSFCR